MSNERIALYVCGQSHHGSCELNGVSQIQFNPLQTLPMLQSGTVRRRPQVTGTVIDRARRKYSCLASPHRFADALSSPPYDQH